MYDGLQELRNRILPLKITLSDKTVKELSGDMTEACRQLYHYTVHVYDAFLENPEQFFIDKEGRMINIYGFFVKDLADFQANFDGGFQLTEEQLNGLLGGNHKLLMKNLKKHGITFEMKLKPLRDLGWKIDLKDDLYCIHHPLYPNMVYAMRVLWQAAEKTKGNFKHYILRSLDFRILANAKHLQPTEDIIRMLPANVQSGAFDIYKFIQEISLRENHYTVDCVRFDYKRKFICAFRRNHLYIPLGDEQLANQFLWACDDIVKQFVFKHLRYCTHCTPSHGGVAVTLCGKNVRVCAEPGVCIRNLDDSNEVAMAKYLIKMKIINAIGSTSPCKGCK